MSALASVLLSVALCGVVQPPQPEFEFVLSQQTQQHIAIQPQADHHRIYFPVRIRNLAGQRVFARIRTETVAESGQRPKESSSEVLFDVVTDNDVWAIYLRVPRYTSETAIYQIELGTVEPNEIDVYHVRQSTAWEVRRDAQGKATILRERPGGGAVMLRVPRRLAVIEGGMIKIRYAYGSPGGEPIPLQLGVDETGNQLLIFGENTARKMN